MARLGWLDREHSVAPPNFNRWMVPPAALAIHLCIGQVYAFSVFNKPLSQLIGGAAPAPGDWSGPDVAWIFSLAIVCLGLSAALTGRWLEHNGPRLGMAASAAAFGAGFGVAALGVSLHELWLVYVGYGVLGGIGLGIGYISPVSTLIRWFPDRPGMATGLAIMGFGGGALVGSPLAVGLMAWFKGPDSSGVPQTFAVMGAGYFLMMMLASLIVRVPRPGWTPAGYRPDARIRPLITKGSVPVYSAVRTPQFYLLWGVLCLNVSAGIGILAQASPMVQDMFPERVTPAVAGGFVGLLSLFNMAGRFFWSSVSDHLGRKPTYMIFFVLGFILYGALPSFGRAGNLSLFVACSVLILTMYGGGFATVPAYLRDVFGVMHVGAIHGRLLTAWSVAGVLGPQLIVNIHEHQLAKGVPKSQSYDLGLYVVAGLLAVGFVCNLMMSSVNMRHHVPIKEEA